MPTWPAPLETDPGDEQGNDTTTPLPDPPDGHDIPEAVFAAAMAPACVADSLTATVGVQVKLARPLHGPGKANTPTVGPDVVAVKRATARAFPELFSWADFDQIYNARLKEAWRQIQREYKVVPVSGNYGAGSHRLLTARRRAGHPGEWAWDATAINLMEGEWKHIHNPPMPPIARVEAAMVDYMSRTLANAARIHYAQRRPMTTLGLAPERTMYNDCSEGATDIFYWARMVTGIQVPDPNGRGYDGSGNTDTLWGFNESRPVTDGRYMIGDLVLYSNPGHVIVCLQAGDRNTAVFWSNGSESAPNTTRLFYRNDLRGVVRPRLVP